jgi:hypothetical protein
MACTSVRHFQDFKFAWRDLQGHRHGKHSVGRSCKKRADDMIKLSRHQLKMVLAILTGHAAVSRHLKGILPADSAGRRLKQCSISSAAARRWLVSATMSLGIRLSNQNI